MKKQDVKLAKEWAEKNGEVFAAWIRGRGYDMEKLDQDFLIIFKEFIDWQEDFMKSIKPKMMMQFLDNQEEIRKRWERKKG